MKKSEILKKIKCEILNKAEAKEITGGYTGYGACPYPKCPSDRTYPPFGVWGGSCGVLYWDNQSVNFCRA